MMFEISHGSLFRMRACLWLGPSKTWNIQSRIQSCIQSRTCLPAGHTPTSVIDDGHTAHLHHGGVSNTSEGGSTMATAGGSIAGSVTSGPAIGAASTMSAGKPMDSNVTSTATSAVSSMDRGEMARGSASLAVRTSCHLPQVLEHSGYSQPYSKSSSDILVEAHSHLVFRFWTTRVRNTMALVHTFYCPSNPTSFHAFPDTSLLLLLVKRKMMPRVNLHARFRVVINVRGCCSCFQERGMSGLLSSDEHWTKAQAATEEARRQAKIVEAGARRYTYSQPKLSAFRLSFFVCGFIRQEIGRVIDTRDTRY